MKRKIVEDTSNHVRVVYLDRATAKGWNQQRRPDDTPIYCGWYWLHDPSSREGGPFKTYSAALRDAYYRFVKRTQVPTTGLIQHVRQRKRA